MTNKWTVNGVEAPEGAEFYANDVFWKDGGNGIELFYNGCYGWRVANRAYSARHLPDYQERPMQPSSDYAFCLSEAIKKLKICADVAPDDKRKGALLEIVEEVEFIKSEWSGK